MPAPILLLNCGSSSIKYQVIDGASEQVMATGLVQRIGLRGGIIEHTVGEQTETLNQDLPDHAEALRLVVELFDTYGPNLREVIAVGHRTVHGGETFRKTTLITDEVIDVLKALSPLAPLHNPPGIAGIEAARRVLPDVPHVAIFDTAFFSTLPAEAYTYAIDAETAHRHHIRKYGFHGTSHSFVSKKTAEILGRDLTDLKQIVCHLGNGASISAIRGGIAVDTSMGLTPLEGLVMGTRSGDVDPGLHAYLHREVGMSIDDIDALLNKRSGMIGLTGSSDMRDVATQIAAGDAAAKVGFDVYVHRLISYIGAYLAVLGGADVLVFTAGIGENDAALRAAVVGRLAPLGFHLDDTANATRSKLPRIISLPDSPVTVMVVPTNEELAMVRETLAVTGLGGADAGL